MYPALFLGSRDLSGNKTGETCSCGANIPAQTFDDWINETGKRHLYSETLIFCFQLWYWIWVNNTSFHYDISFLLTTYINSIIRTYECSEKNFRDREEKRCMFILNSNFTQKFYFINLPLKKFHVGFCQNFVFFSHRL